MLQNGMSGFNVCNTSALPGEDCCSVKCFGISKTLSNKPDVAGETDPVRTAIPAKVNSSTNAYDDSETVDLRKLVCEEVIIDGFSILAFQSKKDLMLYSSHCESECRKIASACNEEGQLKRPKRSASGRPRRPKLLFKRTLSDRAISEIPDHESHTHDEDTAFKNVSTTIMDMTPSSENSNRETSSRASYNLPSYAMISDAPYSHSTALDMEDVTDPAVVDMGEGTGVGRISPLRLSRMNKGEASRPVVHNSARHSAPTSSSEPDHRGDFCITSDADSLRKPAASSKTTHSSPSGSVLSSSRNCHLTPLSITWNPPVLHSKSSTGSGSGNELSVLDSGVAQNHQPSEERSCPGVVLHGPTKAAPCHQFSVAALTDEPARSSPNRHTPVESSSSPAKSISKSGVRRSAQYRARNGTRTSVLHSPLPSSEEIPHANSFSPTFLPTAPRSGSTSPFSQTQPLTFQTQHMRDKLPNPPIHPDRQNTPITNGLSYDHSGSLRTVGTLQRAERLPTFSGPSKLPSPTLPSLPMGRPSAGFTVNPESSKLHRPLPTTPTSSQQRSVPPSSVIGSSNIGTGTTTPHVPVPDSRLLQQMLGVDLTMATQLLKDHRFRDLYSLTMANLTSNEKKSNAGVSPTGSVSSTKPSPAGIRVTECEVPVSVASSLNALVKMTSTDMISPSSMDMLMRLHSVQESNQIGLLGPRAASTSQPIIRNPSSLIHPTYHDHELLSRIPASTESATQTQSPSQPTLPILPHGNLNATGMKLLPPPPPLTAGHSTDTDCPTSTQIRPRYPTVPPPPMLSCANPLSISRPMPNAVSTSSASSQLPNTSVSNSIVQSQWELFFRQMFGGASAPVGFTSSNPLETEASVRSPADNLPGSVAVVGLSRTAGIPPIQSPAAPAPRPPTVPFSPGSSNSFGRTTVQPSPLPPPPYNLSPVFHSQVLQPPMIPVPPTGHAVSNTPKHGLQVSPNPTSLLHHKAHPDKPCGRWADAHVRVARFIHLCQSVRSGQLLRNDRRHISSCTGPPLPQTVVRPVARHDQPHGSSSRPALNAALGHLSSRLQSPQTLACPRQWDSLVHPQPYLRPQTSQPTMASVPTVNSGTVLNSTAEFDKNPFWNYVMNSVMSNLSPNDLAPGHSASGSEAVDAFWSSVLQKLTRTGNNVGGNAHSNSDNHSTGTGTSNSHGKLQSGQPISCPVRSIQGLPALSSDSILSSVDHIPQHGPRYPPSNSSVLSHSLNPLRHGSHSSLPVHLQAGASDNRLGLDSKRPRLESISGHCDRGHQTQFPLASRFPHPSILPVGGSHQNSQDVIHAAARLLNGFHGLPSVSASGSMVHQASGLNDLRSTEILDKTRLKMGGMAPNLAPVHRW